MSAINYQQLYGVPTYSEFINSPKVQKELSEFDIFKGHQDYDKFIDEIVGGAYQQQYGYLNEKIADNIVADLKTESARNYEQLYDEQRYPRLMAGLESAGINPLYAVNGATVGGGSGVGTSYSNMASTSTARDEMRVRNAMTSSQIELNKMQGVASMVGAIGSIIGALGGASHNFGFTTAKGSYNSNINSSSYTRSLIENVSSYVNEVMDGEGNVWNRTYHRPWYGGK